MTRALIMTSILLVIAGFISTRDNQRAMGQDSNPPSIPSPQINSSSHDAAVARATSVAQKHVRQVSGRLKTLANALGIDTAAQMQQASALSQISE